MTRERDLRAVGVQMLRAMGARVYVFSENRPTRNAPGTPDVYGFLPNGRGTVWWESKGPRTVTTPAQVEFEAACLACGQPYVRGTVADLAHFLRGLGIIVS